MSIEGAYPCPSCAAPVTAWRHEPKSGQIFDADPFNPYIAHRCNADVLRARAAERQLERVTDLLIEAVIDLDGAPRERARTTAPAAAARPERAYPRPAPSRPAAAPSHGGQSLAVVAGERQQPTNGRTVDA